MSEATSRAWALPALLLTACAGGGDDGIVTIRDGGTVARDAGPERDAGPRDGGPRDGGPARDGGPERDGGPGRDGGFSCVPPEIECDNGCVDPYASDAHCGGCGNACTAPDTCLVGVCNGPPLVIDTSVAPHLIGPGCVGGETQADVVALDAANTIYIGMLCGDDVRVAMSSDRGATFTTPVSVGAATPKDVTIVADGPGVVYAFIQTTADALVFSRSFDYGATWGPVRILDGGPINSSFNRWRLNAIARRGFVATAAMNSTGSTIQIYRNVLQGSGAFARTTQLFTTWGGNLAFDPTNDDVLLVAEGIVEGGVFRSTDRAESFQRVVTSAPATAAPEFAVHPPYAFAACSISSADPNAPCFNRLDMTTEQTDPIALPTGYFGTYGLGYSSVAVGTDGSAYFALSEGNALTPTAIAVGRVLPGATSVGDVHRVSNDVPNRTNTIDLKIVPGTTAAVLTFTTLAGVWAAVHVF